MTSGSHVQDTKPLPYLSPARGKQRQAHLWFKANWSFIDKLCLKTLHLQNQGSP